MIETEHLESGESDKQGWLDCHQGYAGRVMEVMRCSNANR